jgi:hypothetical protein
VTDDTSRDGIAKHGQSPLEMRADCLRNIITEVREMIGRAEASGMSTQAASLEHLVKHYERELSRAELGRDAVERARRLRDADQGRFEVLGRSPVSRPEPSRK